MIWTAVLVALAATVSGEVCQQYLQSQAEMLAQFMSQVEALGGGNYTAVQGVLLHDQCTDSNRYHDCNLVVQNNLCNTSVVFAHHCCRSCTTAKQLPTHGPHLKQENSEQTPRVKGVSEAVGSLTVLTCEAEGYPEPELFWFTNGDLTNITSQDESLGGVLVQRVTSRLTLDNIQDLYSVKCVAMNEAGRGEHSFNMDEHKAEHYATGNFDEHKDIDIKVEELPLLYPDGGRVSVLARWDRNFTLAWYAVKNSINRIYSEYDIIDEAWRDGDEWVMRSMLLLPPTKRHNALEVHVIWDDKSRSELSLKVHTARLRSTKEAQCEDRLDPILCYRRLNMCLSYNFLLFMCCHTCRTVYDVPVITSDPLHVYIDGEVYYKRYSDKVELVCKVDWVLEEPSLTWFVNDQPPASHYIISDTENDYKYNSPPDVQKRLTSSLTIESFMKQDLGKYSCVASVPDGPEASAAKTITITDEEHLREIY